MIYNTTRLDTYKVNKLSIWLDKLIKPLFKIISILRGVLKIRVCLTKKGYLPYRSYHNKMAFRDMFYFQQSVRRHNIRVKSPISSKGWD